VGGEIKRKGEERRGGEGRGGRGGMVGFLDGKGNGGIEVVGFGGPGAFSLFFSSSLRALLCTHTHTRVP